ncbi:hypothetical protein V2G26_013651 [Clonostachys chloroleuca]
MARQRLFPLRSSERLPREQEYLHLATAVRACSASHVSTTEARRAGRHRQSKEVGSWPPGWRCSWPPLLGLVSIGKRMGLASMGNVSQSQRQLVVVANIDAWPMLSLPAPCSWLGPARRNEVKTINGRHQRGLAAQRAPNPIPIRCGGGGDVATAWTESNMGIPGWLTIIGIYVVPVSPHTSLVWGVLDLAPTSKVNKLINTPVAVHKSSQMTIRGTNGKESKTTAGVSWLGGIVQASIDCSQE